MKPVLIHPAPQVWIEAGVGTIGDDHHYPEERPARTVSIDGFWLDRHPVTNGQFEEFVDATGHVTDAERRGGNVFVASATHVDLAHPSLWWQHEPLANWRRPRGTDVIEAEHRDHPVVQVSQADALAFAQWSSRRLPTEAEWEWAASAGGQLSNAWPLATDGMLLANVWLGEFPWKWLRRGTPDTMAVGSFPANVRGLFDMLGNVWEWTSDAWTQTRDDGGPSSPCCTTTDPDVATVKGGSFLCAANYCARYRPSARHPQPRAKPTCHIGFRCARSATVDSSLG